MIAGTSYTAIADSAWTKFTYAHKATGFISLERGFIILSMLWSTLTVFVIEKKYLQSAIMSGVLAVCSWIGIIHTFQFNDKGQLFHRFVKLNFFQDQWEYALAYVIVGIFFLLAFILRKKNLLREEDESKYLRS